MDFRLQGEVHIMIYLYIKKRINSLPDDMKGTSKHTTAPEYLFWTNAEQAIKLSKETSNLFHKITVHGSVSSEDQSYS